jgi:hypothetical protein
MFPIFETGTIDSTVCNSTTHELWSYGTQETTVRDYLGVSLSPLLLLLFGLNIKSQSFFQYDCF